MGISLVKGQKISLAKDSGELSKVVMGLGWDPAKKKGFFGFFKKTDPIDLDASCCLFDESKNPVDMVWFRQLKSRDGSIIHTGDNLTGDGEGDDEQIIVDLTKVPAHVKYLVFTVNSFRGQTFNEVDNAYCRLVDSATQKEMARYSLSGGGNYTAMVMAKLYRHQGEWKMHALGDPANGQVIEQLLSVMVATL
ncbi:MAG: TerD family protein [Deltaproteobacteria bacterium]|jgi:tellurium resistance protein TerZ|nr:TerD family protein [Deltaproteobacteria bacterium]